MCVVCGRTFFFYQLVCGRTKNQIRVKGGDVTCKSLMMPLVVVVLLNLTVSLESQDPQSPYIQYIYNLIICTYALLMKQSMNFTHIGRNSGFFKRCVLNEKIDWSKIGSWLVKLWVMTINLFFLLRLVLWWVLNIGKMMKSNFKSRFRNLCEMDQYIAVSLTFKPISICIKQTKVILCGQKDK